MAGHVNAKPRLSPSVANRFPVELAGQQWVTPTAGSRTGLPPRAPVIAFAEPTCEPDDPRSDW